MSVLVHKNWNFTTWHLWSCCSCGPAVFSNVSTGPQELELHHMASLELLFLWTSTLLKTAGPQEQQLQRCHVVKFQFLWTSTDIAKNCWSTRTTTPEMPCGEVPVLFTTWHLWVFSSASKVRNSTKHKWFTYVYSVQDFQHNFSKR